MENSTTAADAPIDLVPTEAASNVEYLVSQLYQADKTVKEYQRVTEEVAALLVDVKQYDVNGRKLAKKIATVLLRAENSQYVTEYAKDLAKRAAPQRRPL